MSEPNDQGEGEIHHVPMTVCHFQHISMPGVGTKKRFSGFKMGPLCNATFVCVLHPKPFLARNQVIYGRGTQQCFLDDPVFSQIIQRWAEKSPSSQPWTIYCFLLSKSSLIAADLNCRSLVHMI